MRLRPLACLLLVGALAGCHAKPNIPSSGADMDVGDMAHALPDLIERDLTMPSPDLTSPATPDLAAADLALPGDMLRPTDLPPALTDGSGGDGGGLPDGGAPPDGPGLQDLAGVDFACTMLCNAPPPSACQGNNVVNYGQNGACQNGACVYPASMQACQFGCYKANCAQAGLSFLGMTQAFSSQGGVQVNIGPNNPGTTTANDSVSVTTQTFPHGTASDVHLIWATNPNYNNQTDTLMVFDKEAGNNDQWYAIIPKQGAGTQVWFYIRADGYNAGPFYAPGGFGNNFTYKSQ